MGNINNQIYKMKTIALFGASGGLGSKLYLILNKKYNVISISSKLVDITNFKDVNEFFNNNDIDIVINISGKNFDSFLHNINNSNITDIQELINVNVLGNINIISNCLPKMREKKYGRIIIISSILSIKTIPSTAIYSASKSFLDTLVRIASAENISKNITCNTVRLGYFGDGMCERILHKEEIKNEIGLKRWGTVEELSNTLDYIIDTEYFTGQNLNIEGGIL